MKKEPDVTITTRVDVVTFRRLKTTTRLSWSRERIPLWLRIFPYALFGLLDHLFGIGYFLRRKQARAVHPPLTTLSTLTDWVPSPTIRKRQKKLIGDEAAEIAQFQAQGRKWLARWRQAWTWVYWAYYLIAGPFAAVVRVLGKTS